MPTVLVVDDDAGIRESAAMALEKVGLKTVQAGDVPSCSATSTCPAKPD
jgi:DNA-binding NtrC family response regulator